MDEDYEIPEVQNNTGKTFGLDNYQIVSPSNKRHLERYLEIVSDQASDSWLDCYSPNCDDNDYEPIESPPPQLVGSPYNLYA